MVWLNKIVKGVQSLLGSVKKQPEWIFVASPVHSISGPSDWILKGICKEIERYGGMKAKYFTQGFNLPKADVYFFSHFSRLIQFLENPRRGGKRVIWFTHFEDNGKRSVEEVIESLRLSDKVICPSSSWYTWLLEHRLDKEKVTFVLGGADLNIFCYHERSNTTIGFASWFKPLKNPDKILEIVKRMPDKKFLLLGRNWQIYSRFNELSSLPHFQYIETDYSSYHSIYSQMDVFVSVSKVEGGPIPLIEAMMSNVVPVVSRTGFAQDIIRHGENGFIFGVDSDVETIVSLIRQAFELKTNVRETVQHLTWENFVKQLLDFVYN